MREKFEGMVLLKADYFSSNFSGSIIEYHSNLPTQELFSISLFAT